MTKRVFIGARISDKLIRSIENFRRLNSHLDVRWIAERNLHVTLCFIGQIPSNKITQIQQKTSSVIKDSKKIILEFDVFEVKFRKNKPIMFWATFKEDAMFNLLVTDLNEKILNERPKFPIIPHVTVARFKHLDSSKKVNTKVHLDNKQVLIKEIVLYESKLYEKGAEYEAIHSWSL